MTQLTTIPSKNGDGTMKEPFQKLNPDYYFLKQLKKKGYPDPP